MLRFPCSLQSSSTRNPSLAPGKRKPAEAIGHVLCRFTHLWALGFLALASQSEVAVMGSTQPSLPFGYWEQWCRGGAGTILGTQSECSCSWLLHNNSRFNSLKIWLTFLRPKPFSIPIGSAGSRFSASLPTVAAFSLLFHCWKWSSP